MVRSRNVALMGMLLLAEKRTSHLRPDRMPGYFVPRHSLARHACIDADVRDPGAIRSSLVYSYTVKG